jgi:hypothetical protein
VYIRLSLADNNKFFVFKEDKPGIKIFNAGCTGCLAARKEISAGLDKHLLFTIYVLFFTIIVFTADRRFV